LNSFILNHDTLPELNSEELEKSLAVDSIMDFLLHNSPSLVETKTETLSRKISGSVERSYEALLEHLLKDDCKTLQTSQTLNPEDEEDRLIIVDDDVKVSKSATSFQKLEPGGSSIRQFFPEIHKLQIKNKASPVKTEPAESNEIDQLPMRPLQKLPTRRIQESTLTRCSGCDKMFKKIQQHKCKGPVKTVSLPDLAKPATGKYRCTICHRTFRSQNYFENHLTSHLEVCPVTRTSSTMLKKR
jgi:hypothetical protein